MFDLTNKESLRKAIDSRDLNCHIIPLYVHINNKMYGMWELHKIESFSINTLKVGFGSSIGLDVPKPMLGKYKFEFDIKLIDNFYNYDNNMNYQYYVFETGFLTDEEIKQSEMHEQIEEYIEAIAEYVEYFSNEYRKRIREEMLNDPDSYIG